jgi:hypothetical protein
MSRLAAADIAPILILAPVAPHLADALEVHPDLQFFPLLTAQIRTIVAAREWPMHDFTRAALLDPDCWVDRYHASEGAYAWMVARMLENDGKSKMLLGAYTDKDSVDRFGTSACKRVLPF